LFPDNDLPYNDDEDGVTYPWHLSSRTKRLNNIPTGGIWSAARMTTNKDDDEDDGQDDEDEGI
jgi:hypothetical protein